MKRISCLVLTLLLALLCACGQTDTLPADDPPSADPVASLDDIPQVCRLYYTYADWSPIAHTGRGRHSAARGQGGAPGLRQETGAMSPSASRRISGVER